MNFDDINKIYTHMSQSIYPNVQTVWDNVSTEEVLIDRYLSSVDDNRLYKVIAVPYLMNAAKFLKAYKEKCVIFYNTPDPQDGLLLFIHQISPSVHVHSRFFCWVENNDIHDYLTSLVFHKKSDDAVNFINSSFQYARSGNTEERVKSGFQFS